MRRLLTILILIQTFNPTYSQLHKDKALFHYKNGIIFQSKIILIPENDYFLFEQYTYGGGIFSANPFRDTLYFQTDSYVNEHSKIYNKNGKYYRINDKGKTSKLKFKELEICSQEINLTRNWTYKENLRYKLSDTIRKCFGSFHKDWDYGYKAFYSNELCNKYCYKEFIYKADSLYQQSMDLINKDYLLREKRFRDYDNSHADINSDFVDSFLKDFISCRFDQKVFYDLLINYTDLLISRINLFSDSDYQELTYQIIGMPTDLNSKFALQKISKSSEQCRFKEKLMKDIKMYWR